MVLNGAMVLKEQGGAMVLNQGAQSRPTEALNQNSRRRRAHMPYAVGIKMGSKERGVSRV
jgi:hypothetical protein